MVEGKKVVKYFLKALIYFGLFFVFCYFYMVDQMNDFIRGRRTVSSRFEEAEVLEPPTITICMDIPLKPSVSNQYGFANQYSLIFGNKPNLSNPEKFDLMGYVLNRDYEIQVTTKTWNRVLLREGFNDFEGDKYDVMKLKTFFHGICYKIQPLTQLTRVPFQFYFALKLNESLGERDQPKAMLIYLTSNDSWHGISTTFWPQYNPAMVKSNFENKFRVIYLKAIGNVQLYFIL